MSLSAASAALGIPEPIVARSAAARAQATGVSADDILAAWAGGSAAPAGAAPTPAPAAPADTPAPETPAPAAATPTAAPAPVAAAPTAPAPAAPVVADAGPDPDAAPLLVGRNDSPRALVLTVIALLLVGAFGAAFAPTQAARSEVNEMISGRPAYSAIALDGRDIYLREGCASCHTMLVRSTVTDADLGRVTRVQDVPAMAPDTLGRTRIGPDLARFGDRNEDLGGVIAFLRSPDAERSHPPYAYLGDRDLAALAQFLVETK